uniref:DC1 domain-containing protein n=1 Tax=Nelumbo nucifera TaxID=4432 RepID=A0A822XPB3_NELNU|nr:TPA_asm: hypothetical protein HUJ06_023610 [Nelumbo nucifera]
MGKLNYDPVIQHFSHPHPLELCCNHQQLNLHAVSCSGCKLKLASAGPIYTCRCCNFFLHISCSQMPQHIAQFPKQL